MDDQPLSPATRTAFTAHRPQPDSNRARGLASALTVALLIVVGLTFALLDTHDTGQRWQHQAEQAEQELEQALAANSGLHANLNDAESDLDDSQTDVARLERRLIDLADVQAQTADQRNRMVLEASTWREITQVVAETTTDLDICVDLMVGLHDLQVSTWNIAQLGGRVDVSAVNRAADETFALCNNVRERAWILRALVLDQ